MKLRKHQRGVLEKNTQQVNFFMCPTLMCSMDLDQRMTEPVKVKINNDQHSEQESKDCVRVKCHTEQ